uniref:Uncharacterized protein n=1 Tax=Leersia perrieri TaxID=77586 RepID=A0A0D9X6D5_9ORYZ
MNEKLTRDEAIYLLLAEFKLLEAHRRFDEKLDRLLEIFGAKEAKSEAYENKEVEPNPSIRMTTTDFKSASSSPPPTSPTRMLTNCSMVCPNDNITSATMRSSHINQGSDPMTTMELVYSKEKAHTPHVDTTDLSMVMLAKCSTLELNVKWGAIPDHDGERWVVNINIEAVSAGSGDPLATKRSKSPWRAPR